MSVDELLPLVASFAMPINFQVLDYGDTPIGTLMLRKRRMISMPDTDIYEVKLGDYFLMSSLFHEAEYQLAVLGLAELEGEDLEVLVGGLGLGYTAKGALDESRVKSLHVIEYLEKVIDWHCSKMVPLGEELSGDPRCSLVHADFFACSADLEGGFVADEPGKTFDAILLDIDHTPDNVLHQTNTRFYTTEGLTELKAHLKPNGVFALWSDGAPEESFREHLDSVFATAVSHQVDFENPVTGGTSCGTVYVARMA